MRAAAGGRSGTGSATLPAASLYAPANNPLVLVEVGIFNTTTTAVNVALRRLTTAGTPGTALDEVMADGEGTPIGTAFNTHSVGPTITNGVLRQGTLGAAAGAGIIWTGRFFIPKAVTNGIGILIPNGSGQVVDFYFEWEE